MTKGCRSKRKVHKGQTVYRPKVIKRAAAVVFASMLGRIAERWHAETGELVPEA